MKESMWGYLIIILGLVIIAILLLVQRLTTTNEEDFYLGREVMEAAMIDAIDYGTYRSTGELIMSEQKFVEVFVRRFAESVTPNKTYTLDFYDIYEYPPKASVRIKTSSGATEIKSDNFEVSIDTFMHGILETVWGQGELKNDPGVFGGYNTPLIEEDLGTEGFGGDEDNHVEFIEDNGEGDGSLCEVFPDDPICNYKTNDYCDGSKCYFTMRYYSVGYTADVTENSRNRKSNYTIGYTTLSDHIDATMVSSCSVSNITHSNDISVFTKWRALKDDIHFYLINAKSEGIYVDADVMASHSASAGNFSNDKMSCKKSGTDKIELSVGFDIKELNYNSVLKDAKIRLSNGTYKDTHNVLFIPTQFDLTFEYNKNKIVKEY